ncbi:MAG TPA: AAA family ATPase [Euzebyales bacterium]|nr:AAA family ATPase [Euzebyales bacterium]
MAAADASDTLGDVLASRRRQVFVGRTAHRELFRAVLAGASPFAVLYVHGPGGIGKTQLLDALADDAHDAGVTVVRHDGRELTPTVAAVRAALVGITDVDGPIVLLIDSYDLLEAVDGWIRDDLLPTMPAGTVTVLAGRNPPGAGWRADPGWRDLLRIVSLRNLTPDESRTYLQRCGVDPAVHDELAGISHGHPLTLSLLADTAADGDAGPDADPMTPDIVGVLVRRFVDVVPTGLQRRALEASALARVTTEALLRDALDLDDATDVFAWLRQLSFVESGSDGAFPHDLARDVLDRDLRWRDPQGYATVFRRVRAHIHDRLATLRGHEQQRALFDEKFVFRNLPSILSPVDWDAWGRRYAEPARPEDRDAIVTLVGGAEGEASAAIAQRWWELQPEAFHVLRRPNGDVRGVLGLVELAAVADDGLAWDPGAAAAMAHAGATAPPRPGELVTLTRFVVDAECYQDPSPTLNATPILTLQRYLQQSNLSWDFLALAEPDRWDAYFAVADLARVEGGDFTVGGRCYGLFAHDFRRVGVDGWLELITERALAQDPTLPPPTAPEVLVLSQPDFTDAVRQALRDLRRPDLLQRNPLLRTRLLRERIAAEPDVDALRACLDEAIDTLRDHPRDDKLLRAVDRTYLRPAATQEAAAEVLGLPWSTYRRHLTKGVERIVSWLWEREVYAVRTEQK